MAAKPKTIDEYLLGVQPDQRVALERIRQIVKSVAPEVEETISYNMPTMKYKGRALVYFTASKKHMSLMPSCWAIEEFKDQLKGCDTTEHTIRFTLEKPLPDNLVEALVRNHVRDIDAGRQAGSAS